MPPQTPTADHDHGETPLEAGDGRETRGKTVARHRRRSRIPALSLVAAVLFFFGPAVAFAFGDRAAPIENRPLAAAPSLDSGWQAIPGFNAWAIDHLPLRSQAVRADADLSEAVFGEPPSSGNHTASGIGSAAAGNGSPGSAGPGANNSDAPRVIQGTDDWLYYAGDFKNACDPKLGLPDIINGLKRLSTALEASGRKLVISVIPDKSTADPQYLPESFAFKNCSEENRRKFWPGIVAANLPFVDLRGPLAAAERAAQHPMYLKLNTHWNMQGAAVWTKSILAALDPRLIAGMSIPGVDQGDPSHDSPFVAGPTTDIEGDLTIMLGARRTEPMQEIAVRRKGVTLTSNGAQLAGNVPPQLVRDAAGTAVTSEASTTAAPLYPGHTLILGDSFYNSWRWLFAPFMSKLTAVYIWANPASITQSIIDSDTVVLEVVERDLWSGVALTAPGALDDVEKSLAAHHR